MKSQKIMQVHESTNVNEVNRMLNEGWQLRLTAAIKERVTYVLIKMG
jgi:hypothetical protein